MLLCRCHHPVIERPDRALALLRRLLPGPSHFPPLVAAMDTVVIDKVAEAGEAAHSSAR